MRSLGESLLLHIKTFGKNVRSQGSETFPLAEQIQSNEKLRDIN